MVIYKIIIISLKLIQKNFITDINVDLKRILLKNFYVLVEDKFFLLIIDNKLFINLIIFI